MKNINNALALVTVLGVFTASYGRAVVLDTPTANLTERWISSDAGWVVKDTTTLAIRPVVWTNGTVGVKFAVRASDSFPAQESVDISGAGTASSGRFVGDYNLRKIESVSFDIQTVNLIQKPSLYFVSSSSNTWYYKLSDIPSNTVGNGVSKVVPLMFSDAWRTYSSASYRTAENFELDKAHVIEIGIGAERYVWPAQQVAIDNLKLIGPWGQPFTNNVPLAWLMENNLAASDVDTDGDGFSNASEYLAGTNPNDSNSFFVVKIGKNALGKTVVTWNENKYVWFDLMQTTNLGDPNSFAAVANAADLSGSGTQREVEVDDTGSGVKFFKVVIKPNPSVK